MDQKLFLEKLSEVAEWQWSDCIGETNRNFRSEEHDIETPKELKVKALKVKTCEQGGHHSFNWKIYNWRREDFWVGRCQHCQVKSLSDGRLFILPKNKTTQLANEAHNLLTGRPTQVILVTDEVTARFAAKVSMSIALAQNNKEPTVIEDHNSRITIYHR